MAKKPLGSPKVPEGPQREFFLLMQHMVLEAGDLSLQALAKELTMQKQALHRALVGPDIPPRHKTVYLAERLTWMMIALDPEPMAEEQQVVTVRARTSAALASWTAAVADQRRQPKQSPPTLPAVADDRGELVDHRDQAREKFQQALTDAVRKAGNPPYRLLARKAAENGKEIPSSTLSDMLRGKSLPRLHTLAALLDVLPGVEAGDSENIMELFLIAHGAEVSQAQELAAQSVAPPSPSGAAETAQLLTALRLGKSHHQARELAERAADSVPVDDAAGVAELLRAMRAAGALDDARELAARAANSAPVDDAAGLAELLKAMRAAGAFDIARSLAARAAFSVPVDAGGVAALLAAMHDVMAFDDARSLASRVEHSVQGSA